MRLLLTLTLMFTSTFAFANDDSEILTGQWGGDGVTLWATASGADGAFHCSTGRVSEPILISDDGQFRASGYVDFYNGTPPIKRLPATFSGQVVGKVMNLTVSFEAQRSWQFTLRKGELGKTYKCAQ